MQRPRLRFVPVEHCRCLAKICAIIVTNVRPHATLEIHVYSALARASPHQCDSSNFLVRPSYPYGVSRESDIADGCAAGHRCDGLSSEGQCLRVASGWVLSEG